jgi:hypothetical protein
MWKIWRSKPLIIPPSKEDIARYSVIPDVTAEHLALYAAFREYVKHEDDLINNRLNWNFTVQGFLFAAFSFSIQKMAELQSGPLFAKGPPAIQNNVRASIRDLAVVNFLVGAMGLLVSAFVCIAVLAAQAALRELERKWIEGHQEYGERPPFKLDTHGPHLPGLIGAGSSWAHRLGHWAPVSLPFWLAVTWTILLVYLFHAYNGYLAF